jgi:hypothetical protein
METFLKESKTETDKPIFKEKFIHFEQVINTMIKRSFWEELIDPNFEIRSINLKNHISQKNKLLPGQEISDLIDTMEDNLPSFEYFVRQEKEMG